ncbi:MAG: FAD-binding protein [Spirochaetes bacterium]|nr:FAD-binding protein [Spirochaetota bacterium]
MLTGGDKLRNAFESLARIVGTRYALYPADTGFEDYLRDETYLRGDASLVLAPATGDEVVAILAELRALRARHTNEQQHLTLTLRGGGSGLSGAAVPVSGIVLDTARMNRLLDVDEKNLIAKAECGIRVAEIQAALAGENFDYAVDPSSAALCTLGGSIATNAAGPSSLKYGTTRQNLAAVRFVTSGGELISAGALPAKTSMGFSLSDLLCGSEGRLGVILEADVRLLPRAEETALVVGSFGDESGAMDFVLQLRQSGLRPRCVEIVDGYSMRLADFSLAGEAMLMIELDGSAAQVAHDLEKLQALRPAIDWLLARGQSDRAGLWKKRKSITQELKKRFAFKLGEDIAVPLTALAHTAAFARTRAAERGVETAIWGHAGDGNLHVNYLLEKAADLPVLDILMKELAYEVTRVGGAISGEHGLGRLKKKFARAVLPAAYFNAQDRIKAAFDPDCMLNPALELPA